MLTSFAYFIAIVMLVYVKIYGIPRRVTKRLTLMPEPLERKRPDNNIVTDPFFGRSSIVSNTYNHHGNASNASHGSNAGHGSNKGHK